MSSFIALTRRCIKSNPVKCTWYRTHQLHFTEPFSTQAAVSATHGFKASCWLGHTTVAHHAVSVNCWSALGFVCIIESRQWRSIKRVQLWWVRKLCICVADKSFTNETEFQFMCLQDRRLKMVNFFRYNVGVFPHYLQRRCPVWAPGL